MITAIEASILRVTSAVSFRETLRAHGAKRRGTVYHPKRGHIIGFNFGTSVRPEVAPIAVNTVGDETVASFLARGGAIRRGAPKVAKGAMLVNTVKTGTTRVITSRG